MAVVAGFVGGCCEMPPTYQDEAVCKTKDDFRKLSCPPGAPIVLPKCLPRRVCVPKLPPFMYQKVSLSLSGQVPLSEAFFELARQAKFNLAFDAPMSKTSPVLYNASRQRLVDVLDNLCLVGGLRYYFENDTLHVCEDEPYLKTHNIQFLVGVRNTQTRTSVKTDVFAEGLHASKGAGSDNGASFSVQSANTVDFWKELEHNIQLILSENGGRKKSTFSLNKYGGILSVQGTERQQRAVACYLKHLQKLVTTQVLIEAKIIEVELKDEYKCGINWSAFFIDRHIDPKLHGTLSAAGNATLPSGAPLRPRIPGWSGGAIASKGALSPFSFYVDSNYLTAMASFMERFGTVRTLANPRLTVLNNQSAILKVARNEVFFELQIEDIMMTQQTPMIQKAESRIQTVPIGLIMYVHPSINFETGEIILSLHPTISRVLDKKKDPAVVLSQKPDRINPDISSDIPVVQVREMDSVIVARPGQVIVTGGLMEEQVNNVQSGVPYVSDIPLLGNLFKYNERTNQVTELVILLTLSIVGSDPNTMDPADERLYRCFTQDPRPL